MKRLPCVALAFVLSLATIPAFALEGENAAPPENASAGEVEAALESESVAPAENPPADETETTSEEPSELKESAPLEAPAESRSVPENDALETAPVDMPFTIVRDHGEPIVYGEDYFTISEEKILVVRGRQGEVAPSYSISMAQGVSETDWVIVVTGSTPRITLKNVSIKTGNRLGALSSVETDKPLDACFEGKNRLESSGGAGIFPSLYTSANLYGKNGDGSDSLVAIGGSRSPGIGVAEGVSLASLMPNSIEESPSDDNPNRPISCEGISIENLTVTATGGDYAPGIGSGYASQGNSTTSNIFIKNSTVTATGGKYGAGIGSGRSENGDSAVTDIVIESSTVQTTGGIFGAGIGSGDSENGDSAATGIILKNSTVTTTGGFCAAGIGSGCAPKGTSKASSITIESGRIEASLGKLDNRMMEGSGIGSGAGSNSEADGISILGGTVRVASPAMATTSYSAGIGSAHATATQDGKSIAKNIAISGGDVSVEWTNWYGPAIGSGGCIGNGSSEARDISISGGTVNASGRTVGIGSGGGARTLADGICISGGTVTATTTDTDGGTAIGSGEGSREGSTSTTSNLVISGGDVTATSTGTAFGPWQPKGGVILYTTEFTNSFISPSEGTQAELWAGASASDAKQVLAGENDTFDLTSLQAAYTRATFSDAAYNVWVSGVQVTLENAGDVLGDGTVSFSPTVEEGLLPDTGHKAAGTLTLSGASLKGVKDERHGAGICAQGPLVIDLAAGTHTTVKGASESTGNGCNAIRVDQALTITGKGSLEARAGSYGLDAQDTDNTEGIGVIASYNTETKTLSGGHLLITDAAHVRAYGGYILTNKGLSTSVGVLAQGNLVVEQNATLQATGGPVTWKMSTVGVVGTNVILRDNATLEGTTTEGGCDNSIGIACDTLQITGGTLKATSSTYATTQHTAVLGNMDLSSYGEYGWRTDPDGAYTYRNFAQPEQTDYLEIIPGDPREPFTIVRDDGEPIVYGYPGEGGEVSFDVHDKSVNIWGKEGSDASAYTVSMADGRIGADWGIVVGIGDEDKGEDRIDRITLQGVSIKTDNHLGALVMGEDADVYFEGENHLESNRGAGVLTIPGGTLRLHGKNGDGSDSLVAVGSEMFPGVGVADISFEDDPDGLVCKGIFVEGLSVEATGGKYAAGIGTGFAENSSIANNIVIENSKVIATGSMFGAGIGSGRSKSGDSVATGITLRNSTVTAAGGYYAGGIGSGYAPEGTSKASNITIESGHVEASSGEFEGFAEGAGIGSGVGQNSEVDGISILGGTVHVASPKDGFVTYSAGIGSAHAIAEQNARSIAQNIAVSGGEVLVDWTGGSNPAIGSGSAFYEGGVSEARNISISGGTVDASSRGGGIGSGSGGARTLVDGVYISGGVVRATATSTHYRYSAIGSGDARGLFEGSASITNNVVISGGDVTAAAAPGGVAFGPKELEEDVLPYTTEFTNSFVAPAVKMLANLWAGATESEAAQLLDGAKEPFELAGLDTRYAHVTFSRMAHDGPVVTPSDTSTPNPKALAATGDSPSAATLACGMLTVLAALTLAGARRRRKL